MKKIFLSAAWLVLLVAGVFYAEAQKENGNNKAIADLIQSKSFVFDATTVLPMRGGSRILTSRYDLKISGDTLRCDLPYFGRAFNPVDPLQGGFQFTSLDFKYKISNRKKGGWDIDIKPAVADVQELSMLVSPDGTATLSVSSNSRESISYIGMIEPTRRGH
jgi:hypothetical protein